MFGSKKILAAAGFLGLGLVIAATAVSPLAAASNATADLAAQRINSAFAVIPDMPAASQARSLTIRAAKGDFLAKAGCADQKWPNIASECLGGRDVSGLRKVRVVTIGYQAGDATTVLLRMPAPEVASR